MRFQTIMATLLMLLEAPVLAASPAKMPTEAELAPTGEVCQEEGARTLLAYHGRESGIDKALFIGQLAPARDDSPRYVKAPHQIVEDVYRLKDLQDDALYFYRFQVCRVEWTLGTDFKASKVMDSALAACQQQHMQDKEPMRTCIFAAVLDHT